MRMRAAPISRRAAGPKVFIAPGCGNAEVYELHTRPWHWQCTACAPGGSTGYARVHDGRSDWKFKQDRQNLVVVSSPSFNYDRPRIRGEGIDWNEESAQSES